MRHVSTSLSINCWRSDELAAIDALERRTWASLRIVVMGRCVTQFWDRRTEAEAETIYVPAFPLAEWMVANWWRLFYEPCRAEGPPQETEPWRPEQRRWVHRHCLRSAESGLFLPYLHIYSNGPAVSIAWFPDDALANPSMPGYFLYAGVERLDRQDVMAAAGEFVAKVLSWCDGVTDGRVDRLRADWDAITSADPDEQAFCRAAGMMGLDPYYLADWNPGVAELLSTGLGARAGEPLVDDLLESAEPASASALWQWISDTERSLDLTSGAVNIIDAGSGFRRAKDQGYFVARQLRSLAGLAPDAPLDDLPSVATKLGVGNFLFEDHNHRPNSAVRATVGWREGSNAVVAGPRPASAAGRRFLESRGLYHAIVGCRRGPRLVTRAHTWDQQAARAFAAELLAPQRALASQARPDMEPDERQSLQDDLAARYQVSPEVVRLQLENEGLWRNLDDAG